MRGAFTLLEINDGANNSDVITSLVYEICEFFAKRYQRKGIALVKNVRYEICPLLALESIAYGFFFFVAGGRFSAGAIFHRKDFPQGGKFPGVNLPEDILHRGFCQISLYFPGFVELSLWRLNFTRGDLPAELYGGNLPQGWHRLGGFSVGDGVFSAEEILHGRIFHGGIFLLGGGDFQEKFSVEGDFGNDLKNNHILI